MDVSVDEQVPSSVCGPSLPYHADPDRWVVRGGEMLAFPYGIPSSPFVGSFIV